MLIFLDDEITGSVPVKKVLKQNNGLIPDVVKMTVTNFNKTIRDHCKAAGIDEVTKVPREVSGKVIMETRNRYEEVSSHTADEHFAP